MCSNICYFGSFLPSRCCCLNLIVLNHVWHAFSPHYPPPKYKTVTFNQTVWNRPGGRRGSQMEQRSGGSERTIKNWARSFKQNTEWKLASRQLNRELTNVEPSSRWPESLGSKPTVVDMFKPRPAMDDKQHMTN